MKRRHELIVDQPLGGGLLPGESSLENLPRHSLKKRRVVDHGSWKGLGRRKSLRDINNLSHPGSVQHDDPAALKITQNKTNKNVVSVIEPLPSSRPSATETPAERHASPLHDSRPLENLRSPPSVPVPGQPPTSDITANPHISTSATQTSSLPRFVPHDNTMRVVQSRTSQQSYVSGPHKDLDSDQEDEDEGESDEESDEEASSLPVEDPAENEERQRVESRYAEVNKLLGGLVLSRRRVPP